MKEGTMDDATKREAIELQIARRVRGLHELLDAIDNGISNRYVVLERDDSTLYIKDRDTECNFAVRISYCYE